MEGVGKPITHTIDVKRHDMDNHTHVGFAILVRTFIDFYCFYTDLTIFDIALNHPTPTLSPHRRHLAF